MLNVTFKREITKEDMIKGLRAYAQEFVSVSYAEETETDMDSDGCVKEKMYIGIKSKWADSSFAISFPIEGNSVTLEKHYFPGRIFVGAVERPNAWIDKIKRLGRFLQEYIDGEGGSE